MAPKTKLQQRTCAAQVPPAMAAEDPDVATEGHRLNAELPHEEFVEKFTELIQQGTLSSTLRLAYEVVYTVIRKNTAPTGKRCLTREPTSVKDAVKHGQGSCFFAGTISQLDLNSVAFPGVTFPPHHFKLHVHSVDARPRSLILTKLFVW